MRDDLFTELEWLIGLAQQSPGADPARLARAADQLLNALLAVDTKKLHALELTAKIQRADSVLRAEHNPNRRAILCARFGLSHSAIHWHLRRSGSQNF
jgi:hypothetical protein